MGGCNIIQNSRGRIPPIVHARELIYDWCFFSLSGDEFVVFTFDSYRCYIHLNLLVIYLYVYSLVITINVCFYNISRCSRFGTPSLDADPANYVNKTQYSNTNGQQQIPHRSSGSMNTSEYQGLSNPIQWYSSLETATTKHH